MFKTYRRVARFLLAQLHMDLIVTKATQNEIRKALENLPKGLDESYRDALKRIESQNQDDCQRAKRTLYWISHALRPLTVAELQSALAVMPGGTQLDRGIWSIRTFSCPSALAWLLSTQRAMFSDWFTTLPRNTLKVSEQTSFRTRKPTLLVPV